MRKFFFSRSIRTKLLIIILISALPIVMTFVYFLKLNYDQSYKEAKHGVLVGVKSISLDHNAQVEGIRNLLITLSQFPEIQRMDPVASMRILNHILEQSPSSLNIGVADPEGNVIATGVKQPLPIRYKVADRKYFQDAIRTKQFSAGEYTVSRAVGKPTLHFALPVLDPAGNIKVVLYAALDLTKFLSLFEAQHFPANSSFSLIDHKGILLFRYPESKVAKNGQPDSPVLWSQINGKLDEANFIDIGRDGVKRVFGFKRLSLNPSDRPYLFIRASVPDKAVASKTYQLVGVVFVISLLALIISYLFASILARLSFILPIDQLSSSVNAIENGDLSARSGLVHLNDEIGHLAKSFDAMSESLAEKENARNQAEDQLLKQNKQLELEIIERKRVEQNLHENAELLETEIAERLKANEALQERTLELEAEIAEREAAQQNLEEQTTVLEEEIAERTRLEEEHSIIAEQLLQSQKMEAIGLLAGGVAHDFNNILSVILGYSDLLVNRLPEGKDRDNAAQILKASDRAVELTKGLLAFSRKQTFHLERLEINQFVADNVNFMQRLIGEDIELVTNFASSTIEVRADRSQIQQVLMNLATNARDAMPTGGKLTISISWQYSDNNSGSTQCCTIPGHYALINVADDGTGMPRETIERIFEPFFTTKEKGKGTGLGLSIIHGIVTQHNGYICCNSTPGQGTTFSIYIPLCNECELPPKPVTPIDQSTLNGNETILIAEDDSMLMKLTAEILEASGYKVLQACNGEEAVEVFKSYTDEIDLVLLDAIMPKKTGKQAWDEIRAVRPGVRGCFISGYPADIISGKIAIDYSVPLISKPVLPDTLLKKIREVLDGSPRM